MNTSWKYVVSSAILACLVAVVVVTFAPRAAESVNYWPNAEQSLAGLLPEMSSAECKNVLAPALTPTLVASGSAVHLRGSYDVSAARADCWCVMSGAESAATGTGRHFPKGAVIPLRFSNQSIKCACDDAAVVTVCPNN